MHLLINWSLPILGSELLDGIFLIGLTEMLMSSVCWFTSSPSEGAEWASPWWSAAWSVSRTGLLLFDDNGVEADALSVSEKKELKWYWLVFPVKMFLLWSVFRKKMVHSSALYERYVLVKRPMVSAFSVFTEIIVSTAKLRIQLILWRHDYQTFL